MRNILLLIVIMTAAALFARAQTPVPSSSKPATGKSIQEIKNQIEATSQKRNFSFLYDEKSNRSVVRTTRFVLGRQDIPIDRGGDQPQTVTIPSWELSVSTGFDTQNIQKTADEYIWYFNIYNRLVPIEANLTIKLENDELTFKALRSGHSTTSNLTLSEGNFQMDKTQDDPRNYLGNMSENTKPTFFIFKLNRADMEKVLNSPKARITVTKQYSVSIPKNYQETLKTLLDVTTTQ